MKTNLNDQVSEWIKRQVENSEASGVVLGLSGGLDSSVCGALCKAAIGEKVLGLIMPCHSIKQDVEDALLVAGVLDIEVMTIDLSMVFDEFMKVLPEAWRESVINVKPRLRMATLYYIARDKGYLVSGTGNKSELMAGYFTKHGDGAVDILPLGGIYKTEIIEMAGSLGIPEKIITKPPSAGLHEGQTDEGELGVTYRDLDNVLKSLELGLKPDVGESVLDRVEELIRLSEHKRLPAPIFSPER